MKDNDLTCSNCGEKLLEDDKFCPNCGKKRNNKKIVIGLIALIAVVVIVIGAVFLNQENSFPVEVNVGGEVFHIPEGYELIDSIDDEYFVSNTYINHNDGLIIGIAVFNLSFDEAIANIQKSNNHIIYDYNASYGGYSGIFWGNSKVQLFTFERNGKPISISVGPFNEYEYEEKFNEYIPKIIK